MQPSIIHRYDWQIKPQTLTGSSDSSRAIQREVSVQRLGEAEWTCPLTYIVASAATAASRRCARVQCQQPIISKRLKGRDELKSTVRSIDRSARLTPVRSVRVDARRIIEDFDRLTERARASGAGTLGRIVVGLYKSLSQGAAHIHQRLPRALSRHQARTARSAVRRDYRRPSFRKGRCSAHPG